MGKKFKATKQGNEEACEANHGMSVSMMHLKTFGFVSKPGCVFVVNPQNTILIYPARSV